MVARRRPRMLVWIGGGGDLRGLTPHIAQFAAERDALVTFVEVIPESEMIVRPVAGHGWTVPTLARRDALRRLERAAARARRAGLEPETRLLVGSPVQALTGEAGRRRHDFLVVATPRSRRQRALLGRLARESPSPVLSLHTGFRPRQLRVLVAVDISRRHAPRRNALVAKLLEYARWFAGPGGRLHVLHAWDAYGTGFMRRGGASETEIRRYVAEVGRQRRRELEDAIAPFRRVVSGRAIHAPRGDPRDVIPEFARARDFDLVVVGTVARGGLMRWIVGNTAESLLGTVRCSLLVVRP
jgi:universal stress protein E